MLEEISQQTHDAKHMIYATHTVGLPFICLVIILNDCIENLEPFEGKDCRIEWPILFNYLKIDKVVPAQCRHQADTTYPLPHRQSIFG